jgi:hypothetical protein
VGWATINEEVINELAAELATFAVEVEPDA